RTISELRIRQHYGVSVLVIKRLDERGREQIRAITGPDTRLNEGDIMLVLGPSDQVRMLEMGIVRKE
ncbi:MAG: TrkA C-terminal domain-containing protein, partial [Gemmatimonadota bacterium]